MTDFYTYFQKIKREIISNLHKKNYEKIVQELTDMEEYIYRQTCNKADITERLDYKELFDYSLAGLAISTTDQKIIDCNSTLVSMLGYESAEEIKQYPISQFYADIRDRGKVLQMLKEKGSIIEYEICVKTRSGKILNVLLNANLITIQEKQLIVINLVDITRQRKAEEQRKERQRILKATIESTADGILVVDNKGSILIANHQFFKLWKIPETFWHESDDEKVLRYASSQLAEPDEFVRKVQSLYASEEESFDTLQFKDGRIFERFSLPLVKDNENMGRVWSFRDITARVKTQNELQELNRTLEERVQKRTRELQISEKKYRDIFNSIADMFFRVDEKGIIEIINPAVHSILGYKPEEMEGKSVVRFFKNRDEADKILKKVYLEKEIKDYETNFLTKDNESRHLLLDLNIVYDIEGEESGIQGIARDITHRKKLQEERDRLFDFSLDMLCIAGFDGKFKQLNPAWTDVLGWEREEMINKNFVDFVHPEDVEMTLQATRELSKGRSTRFFQNRYITKSGDYKWISWNSFPFQDEELIYAVARDITEKKVAEESLKESEKQLKTLNAQKDKFFSIIAHDLQGPVGNFKQIADLLSEEFENFDILESRELIDYLKKSAKNTYKLLEDLLIWSRTQLGKVDMESEKISLRELVDEIIDIQSEKSDFKNIQIKNEVEEDVYIQADKESISMVIRNILSNAIKFTPKNGKVKIFIDESEGAGMVKPDFVVLAVQDDGIGMPEDIKEKLFKIYEDSHRPGTEEEKGTGLGLILCKELIEKNGGNIWVWSKEGKGSIFYITLKKHK